MLAICEAFETRKFLKGFLNMNQPLEWFRHWKYWPVKNNKKRGGLNWRVVNVDLQEHI